MCTYKAITGNDCVRCDAHAVECVPTVAELIDHIVSSHHRYLHAELPALNDLVAEIAKSHGERYPEVLRIRELFVELVREMQIHLSKEEEILFPMMRHMAEGNLAAQVHCGGVHNPIRVMEAEHAECETALATIRALTKNFTVPEGASPKYREMVDRLAKLDADMREHIAEETDILFPRMIAIGDGRLVEDWHH